jgi:hypothetical protein
VVTNRGTRVDLSTPTYRTVSGSCGFHKIIADATCGKSPDEKLAFLQRVMEHPGDVTKAVLRNCWNYSRVGAWLAYAFNFSLPTEVKTIVMFLCRLDIGKTQREQANAAQNPHVDDDSPPFFSSGQDGQHQNAYSDQDSI